MDMRRLTTMRNVAVLYNAYQLRLALGPEFGYLTAVGDRSEHIGVPATADITARVNRPEYADWLDCSLAALVYAHGQATLAHGQDN